MYKYNYSKMKRSLTDSEKADLGQSLLALMDRVGIRDVTEKNIGELYARIHVLECLYGPSMWRHHPAPQRPEPRYWTKRMLRRYIGLCTNFSIKTRTIFLKGVNNAMDTMVEEQE